MNDKLLTFPFAVMLVISFMGMISGNTIFGKTSLLTMAGIMGGLVLTAILLATTAGSTFLSSGLNGTSISISFQSGALAAVWAALTFTTANFLLLNGDIGGMIWGLLTMMYLIGVVIHIRGGGSV
jgi:hypothetical protein